MSATRTRNSVRQRLIAARDRDQRMTGPELAEFRRSEIGLSQSEFARNSGWSLAAVRQWEQGVRLVPVPLCKWVVQWRELRRLQDRN